MGMGLRLVSKEGPSFETVQVTLWDHIVSVRILAACAIGEMNVNRMINGFCQAQGTYMSPVQRWSRA